jgi:hypothetical protein
VVALGHDTVQTNTQPRAELHEQEKVARLLYERGALAGSCGAPYRPY